jgi:hypothetical protein
MGDHQHHHFWHFLLHACLAPSTPFHQQQFLFQAAAKKNKTKH